jgi:hypothetical protein
MPLKILTTGQIQAERDKLKAQLKLRTDPFAPGSMPSAPQSLVPPSEPVTRRLDDESQARLAAALKSKRGFFA